MKVKVTDGFWADRLRINRIRTIPHGFEQPHRSGVIENLRMAAGAEETYQAYSDSAGTGLRFPDSDVYKWLEAVGWELGRLPGPSASEASAAGTAPGLAEAAEEAIGVVAAAQRDDGYINSYVQVLDGGIPHRDLAWGHEFYWNAGVDSPLTTAR